MESAEEKYRVPNLEKGLSVLEYLSIHADGASLQELKTSLKISQTTVYRILNTLVRLEYIIYDVESKTYKLSMRILTMGYRALNEHRLLETVLPYLRLLRNELRETVCFGVLGETKGIFIEQALGMQTFNFSLMHGKSFELHCSAPGKSIMAYLPVSVRDKYLGKMEFQRFNERTIVDREAYLAELEKVRSKGYAVDDEEELRGVVCIGAPVLNYLSYPVGAIWVSAPVGRITEESFNEAAEMIKHVAGKISHDLGCPKFLENQK